MHNDQTQTLVLTRVLKATPEKVLEAWLNPSFVVTWFKPNERWLKVEADISAEVGGNYILSMTHQDGDVVEIVGKVVELIPSEKLSFSWRDNMTGQLGSESLVTVDLKPVSDGTEITLTHSKIASSADAESFNGGWIGCLDRFADYIAA